ncbi:dihydrolipoamide acetyltransferase family protein [Janibacter sp. G1551]|uniref:dihydrolipoamide acetyltransferase family protein n=1 Tax=Janibacter sp. G1551 TaxID=3420440 RepID=UPI003D06AFB7
MAIKTFNLPDPGEGLVEAEIIEWKVAVGDTVTVNQVVLEIETAKSLVELPIPWAGTVRAILVEPGATVDVGSPIIEIDDGTGGDTAPSAAPVPAEAAAPAPSADSGADSGEGAILVGYGAKAGATTRRPRVMSARDAGDPPSGRVAAPATAPAAPAAPAPAPVTPAPAVPAPASDGGRPRAKPPVRKLAKDHGIDLAMVAPTGESGIITRADVEAVIAGGVAPAATTASTPSSEAAGTAGGAAIPFAVTDRGEERTPIKGVRKMTAQAMVGSAFTAPHVTEWVTLDVTATMDLVERLKRDKEFAGLKVSPLLVLAKALCLAIRRNPGINATWDEAAQEIVTKRYVNLGIAAATPRGLVVPNIKDADLMPMADLARAIGELTETARAGRTQPAEMSGGTITITNVGVFGVDSGTPIINPGESAILCFGAVRRMPWVVTAADGSESIEPRWVTQLALSFDHRLVDGELGSRFLADVAAILGDPTKALVWG